MKMRYLIRCESLQGSNHRNNNQPNQDAYAFDSSDRISCLCIADGASSKIHSELGARGITNILCEKVMSLDDSIFRLSVNEIKRVVIDCIIEKLRLLAKEQEVNYYSLSSTVMLLISNGIEYIICHLGDGTIFAEYSSWINVLSFPQNGIQNNRTPLTTMNSAEIYLRVKKEKCNKINALWAMTDGAISELFPVIYEFHTNSFTMPYIIGVIDGKNVDDATFGFISWRNEKNVESKK